MTGKNVDFIIKETIKVWGNYNSSISTKELNRFLEGVKRKNPPPPTVKFKYIVQVNIKPPTFVLFVKNKKNIKNNYINYLINELIYGFSMYGVIPKLFLKEESEKK